MTDSNKSWRNIPANMPPELLPVVQPNTVEARVGRRRDFRLMFAPARSYIPQPYENELHGETHWNAERPGAVNAEPS